LPGFTLKKRHANPVRVAFFIGVENRRSKAVQGDSQPFDATIVAVIH